MTRILVTGVNGQVGFELLRACQPLGEVIGADRTRCDLADLDALRNALREIRPDVIVNPAAYTAVDAAEQDEALATRINGEAVSLIAEEARRAQALVVHYSTDYVFDGTKDAPYTEADQPSPLNAYGRSKLVGEHALLASQADWLCLRTSWVYASRGKNFLRTVLRLAREREEMRIVADQFGAPTPARLIAETTAHIVRQSLQARREGRFASGLLHLTSRGATSWHGFASAIHARLSTSAQAPKLKSLVPITTAEYPLPAARPRNSRLDCSALERRFDLRLPEWETGVELCMAELE